MTELDIKRFGELCRADAETHSFATDGIGTYNEKRIHRVIKRYVTEKSECFEIKLGRYVADIIIDGRIFEIQTGTFASLSKKVSFYLEQTDYDVCIIHPVISEKTLIRTQRETGEIMRVSRSPKKETSTDLLAELYHIAPFIGNGRLCVCALYIKAEEYRFSEARRYRREGRYDCDLRPTELLGESKLCALEDWKSLVPKELYGREFSSSEFEKLTRLHGRKRYYALNALCNVGLAEKHAEGKKYLYRIVE